MLATLRLRYRLTLFRISYAADQLALWTARDPTSLYTAPNNAVAYINLTVRFVR